ncbi:PEP-CTERM sorting domain-containing protein [Roseomonas elaeocarpi]|uniref:PEP-CTERM sorting domain-containing protein n=1 Tax=Roseomonas elaeocarpi TaxID=907779 RepID=A0ABV6K0A0_9PROT
MFCDLAWGLLFFPTRFFPRKPGIRVGPENPQSEWPNTGHSHEIRINAMRRAYLVLAAIAGLAGISAGRARAETVNLDFSGANVSASLVLTYGTAADAKYPQALQITGVSGTFTDTNAGLNIVDTPVLGLVPVNFATPEAGNLLAPNSFSRFFVATGLSPVSHGALTYDNLYWPGGSVQTATDYPPSGGVFDIYGLMLDIGGGSVVDIWSNGADPSGVADYGIALATASTSLDYNGGGVSVAVPEPASLSLMGVGLLGLAAARRRRAAA